MNRFKIEFQKTSNFIGNGNINFYTNLFYRLCQPASHKIEIKLLFWELILLHQKYWHVTSSEKENFSTFFWIKVDMKCLFWRKRINQYHLYHNFLFLLHMHTFLFQHLMLMAFKIFYHFPIFFISVWAHY